MVAVESIEQFAPSALHPVASILAAIGEWKRLLGPDQVIDACGARAAYGRNTIGITRRVPAALKIQNGAVLPDVMRIAQRYGIPVYPISTGRNWGYGSALPAADDCVILDLSKMQRILHFDAVLGVVSVEPGVTQRMLATFLDEGNHQYMVPVTGAGPQCSLIGNVLERGYGITPYSDHFSAMTDFEAVMADGSIHRTALREAGGEELARLFKWGVGPFSAGLFSQSGIGIVTRMTLMLAPRPECVKVCLFSLKNDELLEPAVDAVHNLLSRLPGIVGGVNLMNRHRVLAMSAPYPSHEVGHDGLIPSSVIDRLGREYQVLPWTGYATLYGANAVVRAAQNEIKRALSGVASRVLFVSRNQARALSHASSLLPKRWRIARTTNLLAKSMDLVLGRPNETALPLSYWRSGKIPSNAMLDPARDGCGLMWYSPLVPMRSSRVREYVDMVMRVTRHHGIEPLVTLTSISDKLFDSTVPLLFEGDQAPRAQACYEDLLATGASMSCFPYRFGVGSMQHLRARLDSSTVLHERIRRSLDPANIMAPGRYF